MDEPVREVESESVVPVRDLLVELVCEPSTILVTVDEALLEKRIRFSTLARVDHALLARILHTYGVLQSLSKGEAVLSREGADCESYDLASSTCNPDHVQTIPFYDESAAEEERVVTAVYPLHTCTTTADIAIPLHKIVDWGYQPIVGVEESQSPERSIVLTGRRSLVNFYLGIARALDRVGPRCQVRMASVSHGDPAEIVERINFLLGGPAARMPAHAIPARGGGILYWGDLRELRLVERTLSGVLDRPRDPDPR